MTNPTIGYPEWRLVPTEPSPEMIEAARLPILCRRDCNVSKATAKDVYRAMLKASPAPEKAPGEWRGISTAPHDGSLILVWRRTDWPDDPFAVVRWEHDGFHEHWWIVHDGKSDHQLRGPEPTHWLPLPAPPALPGGEGKQTLTGAQDQPQPDPIKGRSDTQHTSGKEA